MQKPVNHKADVWYLAGPFYQYAEDVKALARAAGVRIVDANATASREHAAADVPAVTLKAEYAPAKPAAADALRDDGPTLEEYVAAGYKAENYPPQGYAARAAAPAVLISELSPEVAAAAEAAASLTANAAKPAGGKK